MAQSSERWVTVPLELVQQANTAGVLKTYFALARRVHDTGRAGRRVGATFPTLETISAEAGLAKSGVVRSLDWLEEQGWIMRQQRFYPGTLKPTSTEYFLPHQVRKEKGSVVPPVGPLDVPPVGQQEPELVVPRTAVSCPTEPELVVPRVGRELPCVTPPSLNSPVAASFDEAARRHVAGNRARAIGADINDESDVIGGGAVITLMDALAPTSAPTSSKSRPARKRPGTGLAPDEEWGWDENGEARPVKKGTG